MNSGKSTELLQAAFNYEERGQQVLLAKPATDTKGSTSIVSRLGVDRDSDFQITSEDSIRAAFHAARAHAQIAFLLADAAHFLTREQVDHLLRVAVLDVVPVMTYG